MTILVTGGAGYIGSHTCVALLESGYKLVIVDNLCNSKKEVIKRIHEITRKPFDFYCLDIRRKQELQQVFTRHNFNAVIHFAGLKAVGESTAAPIDYYENNVAGSLVLLEVMTARAVRNIVFSSSATVYGNPPKVPIKEDCPLAPANPYGRTKMMIEMILQDLHQADLKTNVGILRYFNPIGAHPSGRIGEDPADIPNNLMPYICQVAVGKLDELLVYGNDYPTPDGTGIRDYIHVMDLAMGHVRALEKLQQNPGNVTYNLGTGKGYSVLEMIDAFEKAAGRAIPYRVVGRRPGDIAQCFADPGLAEKELGWRAKFGIKEMCRDAWHWQFQNPQGY